MFRADSKLACCWLLFTRRLQLWIATPLGREVAQVRSPGPLHNRWCCDPELKPPGFSTTSADPRHSLRPLIYYSRSGLLFRFSLSHSDHNAGCPFGFDLAYW
ncbi:hypothetical protein DGM98_11785 [Xanthomonas citri]|uniref:Secreted protein n=1 Tax=Xanthomonas citri pv. phaseoli var. fuscans TaxID=473423 RepID=A0AB33F2G1_XANCI|nr:hypothetical protein DGM98_11785 [Xanthomonas citri]